MFILDDNEELRVSVLNLLSNIAEMYTSQIYVPIYKTLAEGKLRYVMGSIYFRNLWHECSKIIMAKKRINAC